jgi:DNA-binding NarL/FixJ family response regulator
VNETAATTTIFVLDGDALLLEAIARGVASLGEVHASPVWTDLAGPIIRAVRDPARRVLLICDLETPGLRGLDFLQVVRRHAPGVRVVLFTATPWKAPEGGADALVPKSAGIGALTRTVASVAER